MPMTKPRPSVAAAATVAAALPNAAAGAGAGVEAGPLRRRQRIFWHYYVKQFTFKLSDFDVG